MCVAHHVLYSIVPQMRQFLILISSEGRRGHLPLSLLHRLVVMLSELGFGAPSINHSISKFERYDNNAVNLSYKNNFKLALRCSFGFAILHYAWSRQKMLLSSLADIDCIVPRFEDRNRVKDGCEIPARHERTIGPWACELPRWLASYSGETRDARTRHTACLNKFMMRVDGVQQNQIVCGNLCTLRIPKM